MAKKPEKRIYRKDDVLEEREAVAPGRVTAQPEQPVREAFASVPEQPVWEEAVASVPGQPVGEAAAGVSGPVDATQALRPGGAAEPAAQVGPAGQAQGYGPGMDTVPPAEHGGTAPAPVAGGSAMQRGGAVRMETEAERRAAKRAARKAARRQASDTGDAGRETANRAARKASDAGSIESGILSEAALDKALDAGNIETGTVKKAAEKVAVKEGQPAAGAEKRALEPGESNTTRDGRVKVGKPAGGGGMRLLKIVGALLLAMVAFYFLTFNYYDNRWNVVYDQEWFDDWQMDSEELVVDKVMDARENGALGYYGQMPGYWSQIGAEGVVYSLIDSVLGHPGNIVNYLHVINSALLAVITLLMAFWFWREFNPVAGISVYACMFLSHWMVASGRNLYWAVWTLFLPMVCVLFLCWKAGRTDKKWFPWVLGLLVFATCLVRIVCEFEYISAVLIAMEVPLIYYARRDGWGAKKYLKLAGVAGVAGVLAFAAGMAIILLQLTKRFGSFESAWESYRIIISMRTGVFDVELEGAVLHSLNMPLGTVLNSYLQGGVMPVLRDYRMSVFIYMFLAVCGLVWMDAKRFPTLGANRKRLNGMNLAVLVSFAAPFSWLILAKGHSWIHRHISYILWSVPCLPLIFGVFGAWAGYVLLDGLKRLGARQRVRA